MRYMTKQKKTGISADGSMHKLVGTKKKIYLFLTSNTFFTRLLRHWVKRIIPLPEYCVYFRIHHRGMFSYQLGRVKSLSFKYSG